MSLEDPFWEAARAIAATRRMSIQNLIAEIDAARSEKSNLSSAIRIFVLEYYRGIAAGDKPAGKDAAVYTETAAESAPAIR